DAVTRGVPPRHEGGNIVLIREPWTAFAECNKLPGDRDNGKRSRHRDEGPLTRRDMFAGPPERECECDQRTEGTDGSRHTSEPAKHAKRPWLGNLCLPLGGDPSANLLQFTLSPMD